MEEDQFTITFRGVRGGYPKPGSSTLRYGGNTTCVEICAGEHLIIVDAGTGIISLGKDILKNHNNPDKPYRCILLMTHLHHDHTQGFPFFAPIFNQEAILHIYGLKPAKGFTLEREMHRLVQPPGSPLRMQQLRSQRFFHHLRSGDVIYLHDTVQNPVIYSSRKKIPNVSPDGVIISTLFCKNHPQDGVMVYRIDYHDRSAVISTDTEGFVGGDKELIRFAVGADLLSHDAEYDEHEYGDEEMVRQGWGHSTWKMAVEVAQIAKIKRLALFHHNVDHDDDFLDSLEEKVQRSFSGAFMAREGHVIDL